MTRPPARHEQGSISLWLATSAFAMLVLVGLAVDLGGTVHAQQHARAVAAQAARTGGQQLDPSAAVRGDAARTDTAAARRAATAFLRASGATGTVSVTATTVTVQAHESYDTAVLSLIGITTLPVSGQAEARITRSLGGIEQ